MIADDHRRAPSRDGETQSALPSAPIAHLEAGAILPDDRAAMDGGQGLLVGRPVPEIGLRIVGDEIQVCGSHVNAGYLDPAHPVQQMILSTLADLCGWPLGAAQCGIDGCSAPNPAMPLEALARGFAAFMRADRAGLHRGSACRQIYHAMTEHPVHVGGSKNRLDTVLMQAAKGLIMSKTGAEGCYIAVIPEKDTVIALKAEDGAGRAAQAALYTLLERHSLAAQDVLDAIRPLCLPDLKNWQGTVTGHIRAV